MKRGIHPEYRRYGNRPSHRAFQRGLLSQDD